MQMKIKMISNDAQIPVRVTAKSAGFDVKCLEDFIIKPGECINVKTGIAVQIQDGFGSWLLRKILKLFGWYVVYEIQVRPRSGLAKNKLITVANAPGTIDEDYTGEVGVLLINHSNSEVVFEKGSRIAQLVVGISLVPRLRVVKDLNSTERGSKGFGSSGI